MTELVAEVEDLRVELTGGRGAVVEGVTFEVAEGEVLGLVGESGSGKTTTANALLGYVRRGAQISGGSVCLTGTDILKLEPKELRRLRGSVVGYVPQDPGTALTPTMRIGRQLREAFDVHGYTDVDDRIKGLLADVKLPSDQAFLRRFAHQMSGGQQQRLSLALAFALRPRLIVLDEPTTGLDVTTQAHVLRTVVRLCQEHNTAALYVTHDLAVVSNLADRVMVMYAGRLSEVGPRATMFSRPAHPYTARLSQSTPDVARAQTLKGLPGATPPIGFRPVGCEFHNRCPMAIDICRETSPVLTVVGDRHTVRCHRASEVSAGGLPGSFEVPTQSEVGDCVLTIDSVSAQYGGYPVVHDVSLTVGRNECVALVGESGSGKTTLARAIIGLHSERTGEIRLGDLVLGNTPRSRPEEAQKAMQYIFQSPYRALNPRRPIGEIIASPFKRFSDVKRTVVRQRVADCLEQVSLPRSALRKFPYELSGGERQRVAIARALVVDPEILICDEITSALDVSVQASIVELLRGLQTERGLSLLFITHNLALVRSIANRVAVMYGGHLVEFGPTDDVLSRPNSSYAQGLLRDTPSMVRTGDGPVREASALS